MSEAVREEASRGGSGIAGGEEDEQKKNHKLKGFRKARHLLRLPFTKSGKRNRRRTPPPPPPPHPPPLPSRYEGETGKGCYLCFLPPRSPPDSAIGPSTGSTKPPTYYEFVKSMIEKNDFYSPECNVHRDIR